MTITAGGPFGSAHFFVLEVHPMHHSQKRYKTLYFFAALIAAAISVLLIELGGIGDSDYYWHIVLGREICSTHTIPVADTFSWISQDLGLTETAHS